jgi:adenylate kinase
LDAGVDIDHVIEIHVPDEEIVARLSGRRVHEASGRVYHIIHNAPKVAGHDDLTGEPLVQRPDDHEETVRKRLGVYHDQTEPLVGFYQKLAAMGNTKAPQYTRINGIGSVDAIRQQLLEVLH